MPHRDGADIPSALITNAALGSSLAFIRSLGRRGWRIIAASDQRLVPGFASRYVDERIHHARLTTSLVAAGDSLVAAAQRFEPDLVVPVTDLAIHALAGRCDELPSTSKVALPGRGALETTMDKQATLALAAACGVPHPRTELAVHASEAGEIARRIGRPMVVKPQRSVTVEHGVPVVRHVAFAADGEELARVLPSCVPALVQPWLPGHGVGVELLLHEGRPLAAVQHRRIRETPWTGGASSCRETVPLDPVLYRHAASMLEALGWTGLAMVEFRLAPDGPQLMEINGRVWGSLPLAVRAGMDFPARLAELLLDGPRPGPVDTSYRVGARSRDIELERQWITGAWRPASPFAGPVPPTRREALSVALRLVRPADGYDTGDWRDPMPMAVSVAKAGIAGARSLAARRRRRLRR